MTTQQQLTSLLARIEQSDQFDSGCDGPGLARAVRAQIAARGGLGSLTCGQVNDLWRRIRELMMTTEEAAVYFSDVLLAADDAG